MISQDACGETAIDVAPDYQPETGESKTRSLSQMLPAGLDIDPDIEARNIKLLEAVDREYSDPAVQGQECQPHRCRD